MYVTQFNTSHAHRVIHFTDPREFERHAKKWLTIREAENSYLLGHLPDVMVGGIQPNQHFFTLQDGTTILAAGALFANGSLCMTWVTHDWVDVLADFAVKARWSIQHVHAPAHSAAIMARAYAARTGQQIEIGRAERVYQLGRNFYKLPEQGHLAVAGPADKALVSEWMADFIRETSFESAVRPDLIADSLLAPRQLYLWKSPEPVAMAAWVSPTPHGASINCVYTPPEFRGQGYGKAVTAALAAQMLASGLRYCFILTDVDDVRSNAVYQSVGARTVAEFVRCTLIAKQQPTAAGPRISRLSSV